MYPSESSPCCLFQSFHVLYYILLPCNIILSHNKILLPSACGSSRSLLTRHDRPQHTRTCVEEPTSPLITHLCTSLPSRIAIAKHALLVALKAGLRLVQVFLNSECHTVHIRQLKIIFTPAYSSLGGLLVIVFGLFPETLELSGC